MTKAEIELKWSSILTYLKQEYNVTDVSYKTWLLPLKVYDVDDNILTVVVDDNKIGANSLEFIRNKYGIFLKTAIAEVTGEDYELEFVLQTQMERLEEEKKKENNVSASVGYRTNNFNPKYTFDSFVVGDNNNTAHAAALAVAEQPGEVFNPLFIYGGAGLGKTHLMYAIANYITDHHLGMKVLYVPSETFTNDLVESIRPSNTSINTSMEEFRKKYRYNDVLLIDDIQFIIGKERTQEEFFHTFNEMKESGRQVIISSDKPPREMQILDDRLRSRFEWGLTVDIQIPAFETRVAILKKKQELSALAISDEILDYIATNIKSNIRELEGALTKVVAMSRLTKKEITISLAQEALKDIISPDEKKTITLELVVDVVAEHFDITSAQMFSKMKSRNIAFPRQIAMYLCRQLTSLSLSDIGKQMGNRDHTTVLHGCNKIEEEMEQDTSLKNTVEILIRKINPQ